MIYLYEATKNWETNGIWKIAPAGLDWIKKGNYVRLGDDVTLGNEVTLGNYVTLGNGVTLGNYVTLGNGVTLGNCVRLGNGVTLGDDVTLGNCVTLGDGAQIKAGAEAIDLGWADGYRKCIAQVDGVAYIGAGCRWFTLADALKHWDNKDDRVLTMCLMQSAIYIARYKGWSHE